MKHDLKISEIQKSVANLAKGFGVKKYEISIEIKQKKYTVTFITYEKVENSFALDDVLPGAIIEEYRVNSRIASSFIATDYTTTEVVFSCRFK